MSDFLEDIQELLNERSIIIIGGFMEELIKEIEQFNKERDWDQFHSPENLAKSISIEAGELLECFQWSSDYNKNNVCEPLNLYFFIFFTFHNI